MGTRAADKQLIGSIEESDADGVRKALEAGASPEARKGKDTALRFAFNRRAKDEILHVLIGAGASLDSVKDMMVWAATQPMPVLRAFVEAGADINAPSMAGTPLQVAARAGLVPQVKLLLQKGADPDRGTLIGNPLTDAIRGGHRECVAALLTSGARPKAAEQFGPLVPVLIELGEVALVKELLESGADPNARYTLRGPHSRVQKAEKEVLRPASGNAPVDVEKPRETHQEMQKRVNAEIEAKIQRNTETRLSGVTPLMVAVIEGSIELVDELLSRGAQVDLFDDSGRTARSLAGETGPIALALRAKGAAKVPARSPLEDLLSAAEGGDEARIEAAIKALAPVDGHDTRKSTDGRTALILAIERGQASAVRKLLALGAGLEVKAKTSPQNVQALLASDSQERTPLAVAAALGKAEIAEILLKAGASPEARDENRGTPLHLAAMANHVPSVELLLNAGADIEAKDQSGMTPLLYAAARGHAEVGTLLLARGAQATAANRAKESALHYAVSSRCVALVQALIDRGADPACPNKYGTPPLETGAHIPEIAAILNAPRKAPPAPPPPARTSKRRSAPRSS